MKAIAGLIVTLAASAAAQAQEARAPVLVEYPLLCPGCEEARAISVRYAGDGTSILETHARADTPQIAPANDSSKYLPGEWIAGPMTEFQPARIQHWEDEVGTNFIEVQDGPALQDGLRYVDRRLTPASAAPGEESWSIDDVGITVAEGPDDRQIAGLQADHLTATLAYTRTEYDAEGTQTASTRTTHAFDLWMAEALPFSPLPLKYEPFAGNRVPPYNGGAVGARLMAALAPRLEPHGGILRAEITTEGDTAAMEARRVQDTPEPPMEKFAALPVVAAEQVGKFAGPLFIASLLRGGMLGEAPSARFTLDGRDYEAVSAWKTNDAGDLVIVLSSVEENTSLFLSRPVNGLPDPGTYGGTAAAPFSTLRQMGEDALAAHTGKFQLNGVVTHGRLPTVLTGFRDGTVTISAVSGDTISGSVTGTVSALPTETVSQPRAIPVEMTFETPGGLEDFRFRSVESRLVR